jgi:hypothetical protein
MKLLLVCLALAALGVATVLLGFAYSYPLSLVGFGFLYGASHLSEIGAPASNKRSVAAFTR